MRVLIIDPPKRQKLPEVPQSAKNFAAASAPAITKTSPTFLFASMKTQKRRKNPAPSAPFTEKRSAHIYQSMLWCLATCPLSYVKDVQNWELASKLHH
jgi:hypothetical protein